MPRANLKKSRLPDVTSWMSAKDVSELSDASQRLKAMGYRQVEATITEQGTFLVRGLHYLKIS